IQAYTAAADHQHRAARRHLGDVEHRAKPRCDTAGGDAELIQRQVGLDLHHHLGADHGIFAERADPDIRVDRGAALRQAGAAIWHLTIHAAPGWAVAIFRLAGAAVIAMAARAE